MIRRKKMLPERFRRYCCELLKERGGNEVMVITGVRWAESSKRSKRKMTETCMRNKRKQYMNPIIEWSDKDVWDYLNSNNIPYCKLYDEGWKRLGCVLCPMVNAQQATKEAKRWPKIYQAWKNAHHSYFEPDKSQWDSADDAFNAWMNRDKNNGNPDDNQMMFFED